MNFYELPTPNPAPKPACHWCVDKWGRTSEVVRISYLVKYVLVVR